MAVIIHPLSETASDAPDNSEIRKLVLFLCTGNYYRSRFAEALFNTLAENTELPWRADSRGLATEYGEMYNIGPISVHALNRLQDLGVAVRDYLRYPLQVDESDLRRADLVIALKEAEHRPLLKNRYPSWSDRVEYWHVDDLDYAAPEETLRDLERLVRGLVLDLKNAASPLAGAA